MLEGNKEGCAEALGKEDDEGGPLKLGLLEDDERGLCPDAVGEEDDGGGPLKLGLLEGDEEGSVKSLGDANVKLECPTEGAAMGI